MGMRDVMSLKYKCKDCEFVEATDGIYICKCDYSEYTDQTVKHNHTCKYHSEIDDVLERSM